MKKSRKKQTSNRFPVLLIALGLLLMTFWGVHRFFYNRALTLSDALLASYTRSHEGALPVNITVGDSINVPIVEAGKIGNTWTISASAANHVANSSIPGNIGNTIVFAHNTDDLFGPLDKVKQGDPVAIRLNDGSLHRYTVTSIAWVTTGHTELLMPVNHEALTLYTCGGFFDSLRIVVRAVPL